MDGLIVLWISLAALFLLLLLGLREQRRIRKMTQKIEAFNNTGKEALDVALEEDSLAQLQNAVSDLQHSLLRARKLASEERARTSVLTADISHQLKTPLTTLRLYAELDEGPHREGSLEQIQRMEALIHALLRLERLCADGYTFSFLPQEIGELIGEQWESLRAIRSNRTMTITGSANIRCDEKWLGEAFLNLLKNACEHTTNHGRIAVRLEQTGTAFFCTIADDGGGVPETDLPHLFRRFYRSSQAVSNGAGLGLAIVKEIVRHHHGSISARNAANGLEISIQMPVLDLNLPVSQSLGYSE